MDVTYFLTYFPLALGFYLLWAHLRSERSRSFDTVLEASYAEYAKRQHLVMATGLIGFGTIQVLAGYSDPFSFMAADLSAPVILGTVALYLPLVYRTFWAGTAAADELELDMVEITKRRWPIFGYRLVNVIGGLTLGIGWLLMARSTGGFAIGPSSVIPRTTEEILGFVVATVFMFGGLLGGHFYTESLTFLSAETDEARKAAEKLWCRDRSLFTSRGWALRVRALWFFLASLSAWAFFGVSAFFEG